MDLIYADSSLIDVGVLQDYSFDECFGDDNTFEVKVQQYNPACQGDTRISQDYYLYIEFTEYGGKIDRIESDTKTGVVTFSGRTWHGILNSYVIEPPAGDMYRIYDGEANTVIGQIISDLGLSALFEAETGDSGIVISAYRVRYENAYDCIMDMLKEMSGKLIMWFQTGKVHLGAEVSVNYAVSEEFDSSQVPFKAGVTYNNVNHLICLGQGNGANRAIIHLFTNEGGELMPYKLVNDPKQDSDYILDKSQQVMTGLEEIAKVYDYPNAEIRENYLELPSEPADWRSKYYSKYYMRDPNSANDFILVPQDISDDMVLTETCPPDWYVRSGYQNYYYLDGNDFRRVEKLEEDDPNIQKTYSPTGGLQTEPTDWATEYDTYYEPTGVSGEYQRVSGENENTWKAWTQQPPDWTWAWSTYYTRSWDGHEYEYTPVESKTENEYLPANGQTKKPTDWNSRWKTYYIKLTKAISKNNKVVKKKGEFVTTEYAVQNKVAGLKVVNNVLKWKKSTFYTRETKEYAPKFTSPVYIKDTKKVAPTFTAGRYYRRYVDTTPTWQAASQSFSGYWELKKDVEHIPDYVQGSYFYKVEDRLAELVNAGIEKLEELADTSTLDVDLELESNYDIGDIIGSIDNVTGVEVYKPIIRKIVKIRKEIVDVSYEVE